MPASGLTAESRFIACTLSVWAERGNSGRRRGYAHETSIERASGRGDPSARSAASELFLITGRESGCTHRRAHGAARLRGSRRAYHRFVEQFERALGSPCRTAAVPLSGTCGMRYLQEYDFDICAMKRYRTVRQMVTEMRERTRC